MAISKKQRLNMLKDISAAHLQLRKTISSLSDEQLTRPNTAGIWSGKDVIAHIADWERVYAQVLRDRAEGRPESWPTPQGDAEALNAWNQAQVVARADWSLDEVRNYLEETHDDLMELLERLPDIDPEEAYEYTRDHYALHYDDLAAGRTSPANQ